MKTFGIWLVAIIGAAAIILGGWQAGWWFTAQNADRQQQVDRTNYGAQSAYSQKLADDRATIADIGTQLANPSITPDQKTALTDQRTAITQQACQVASKLTHPTTTESAFIAGNC